MPPLPESFRAPIISTLPTLFISGSLDSNTPPYQAEEVRWGFPNSVHVIVENAGHESTLPLPEVQKADGGFSEGSGCEREADYRSPRSRSPATDELDEY